jgi:hypothetical protein
MRYGRPAKRGDKEKMALALGFTANRTGEIFNKHGRKMTQTLQSSGYLSFTAWKTVLVHHFVWFFFNGPIPENMVIDHKDRNKGNPALKNLRCVTHGDNMRNRTLFRNRRGTLITMKERTNNI